MVNSESELLQTLWVKPCHYMIYYEFLFWPWRCIEAPKSTTTQRSKKRKKMLTMALTDPRCTIGTKIETNVVHVTSLAKCSRRYGANRKTRILVDTFLEVKIEPKATALGRRRTFVVARFYLVRGSMKVAKINIRSVKL